MKKFKVKFCIIFCLIVICLTIILAIIENINGNLKENNISKVLSDGHTYQLNNYIYFFKSSPIYYHDKFKCAKCLKNKF